MYPYVLLTIGKDKSRNKLVKVETVPSLFNKDDEDVLVSLFSYGSEAMTYFQKHSTLTGFRGDMAIDYLIYDIDSEQLEVACGKTKQLLSDLEEKGIESYSISFSGRKGFHIVVPSVIFNGFPHSSVLPAQMLALAKSLTTVDFDRSIYSNLRMFRAYGSKHPKSKLYKIQVEPELLDYPTKILELAKEPRQRFSVKKQGKVTELVRQREKCFELVPEEHDIFQFEYKPKNKLCIAKLLEGAGEGERNEAMCRLISHFKREGYDPDLTFEFILAWNKRNKPPEKLDTLETTFKSIWEGGYSYGCYDWLLDTYCDKECFLYKNKQTKRESVNQEGLVFFSFNDAKSEYDRFVKEDRRIKLGVSTKIDELIKGMAPQQIGVILGRPGALKSTIAMSMGKYFVDHYPGYFLYNSMEMSLAMMYERQMQINLGKDSTYIEQNYKEFPDNQNMNRYLIADKTNVSVKDMVKAIKEFEDKKGDKIEFWVVDYLHAMKMEGADTRARVEKVVKDLTDASRELDTRLIYLAHVHRGGYGKEDSIFSPVKLSDAKDTSSIENSAFFVWGSHLVRDDPDVVVFQMLKNKNGPPFESGVRLYKQNSSLQLKEEEYTTLGLD